MGSLVIPQGLSYTKKDLQDLFHEPIYGGDSEVAELFTVIDDVKTEKELLMISKLEKITKGYKRGTAFTRSDGVVITPRTLRVARMKAEVEQTTDEFWETVFQEALASGVDVNDLENNPLLKGLVVKAFHAALGADAIRQGFFGDKTKEVVTSGAGTGVLDEDYKEYDGVWKLTMDAVRAGTIPAGQRVTVNHTDNVTTVAVANVRTATLTGSSGTANVVINGRTYLATFDTDLTTTAANFVTAHAATIAALYGNVVVTSSGAGIIVTAGHVGASVTVSVTNVSGNLAGSVANTTPAVPMGKLKPGASVKILQEAYEKRTNEASLLDSEMRIYCTRSVYENYLAYLQGLSGGGVEAAYVDLQNGKRTLSFNGMPLFKRAEWDTYIANDFGGVYPHRALMTSKRALVIGTDSADDKSKAEAWYDIKEQVNAMRVQYVAGAQIVHEVYITPAY